MRERATTKSNKVQRGNGDAERNESTNTRTRFEWHTIKQQGLSTYWHGRGKLVAESCQWY